MTGLDDRLRRGLEALAPDVDTRNVTRRVTVRGRRVRAARRVGRAALALSVVGGVVLGLVVLQGAFGVHRRGSHTGLSSPRPERSPSAGPSAVASDTLGLGYATCNVSSVPAAFDGPVDGAWFVATKADAAGACPDPATGFDIVALDIGDDPEAETDFGPLDCDELCSVMGAPDVDSDGVDELMVAVGTSGDAIECELFTSLESGIERMAFDCPDCNRYRFAWGGNVGHMDGAYCLRGDPAGDLVVWSAEQSDDGTHYDVVETTIDVAGLTLTEVDRADSTAPDRGALPPGGAGRFCGMPLTVPAS